MAGSKAETDILLSNGTTHRVFGTVDEIIEALDAPMTSNSGWSSFTGPAPMAHGSSWTLRVRPSDVVAVRSTEKG